MPNARMNGGTFFGTDYDFEDSDAQGKVTKLQGSFAAAYDTTKTYDVGEYVEYGGDLYRCNTAISTAEAWTAAHWTKVALAGDMADVKSALNQPVMLDILSVALLEQGNINTLGENRDSATRLRFRDRFPVKSGDTIVCKAGEGQRYIIAIYATEYSYIGWFTGNLVYTFESDCEIRILITKTTETTMAVRDNTCSFSLYRNSVSTFGNDILAINHILGSEKMTFEQGSIVSGQPSSASDRARTVGFLKVSKGDMLFVDKMAKLATVVVYYYSKADLQTYIEASSDISITANSIITLEHDGYIKCRVNYVPLETVTANTLAEFQTAITYYQAISNNEAIRRVNDAYYTDIQHQFEIGTILSGEPSENNKYCRSKAYYPVNAGDVFHIKSTTGLLRFVAYEYTDQKVLRYSSDSFDVTANGDGYDYVVQNYGYLKFRVTFIPQVTMTSDIVSTLDTLISCVSSKTQKTLHDEVVYRPKSHVKSIAHRGYALAPENTISAFVLAGRNGFEHVETDVRFTSDGEAVLLHDATINRTARNSDGTELSSTVNIEDITYAQASSYDFGIYKGAAFAGETIPKFSDFMAACRNLGLIPWIELKAGTQSQINGLYATAKKYGFVHDVVWAGEATYLNYIKALDDTATLAIVTQSPATESIVAMKTGKNTVIADVKESAVTSEFIGDCIANGIELGIWTINVDSSITGADPYVKWITTNGPMAEVVLNAEYD